MIRIADILGGNQDKDRPEEKQGESLPEKPPVNVDLAKDTDMSSRSSDNAAKKPSLAEISRSMLDKVKLETVQESAELYKRLQEKLKSLCQGLLTQNNPEVSMLEDDVQELIDQIALGNEQFLGFINEKLPGQYLYAHMVNVCILSILTGKQAGFNKSRLFELALGALFHDVGLIGSEDIIYAARKLDNEELGKLRRHPVDGLKMLENIKGMTKEVEIIVFQHHEHMDGSGYPQGITAPEFGENSQIVALVNAYDSLTHTRPYKEKMLNDKAMRYLVGQKSLFSPHFLKLFIECVSIYPVGSWIRLSSGETARVVDINKSSLLKPTVRVYFDRHGQRSDRMISLNLHPNLYIKEQLIEDAVEARLKDAQ